MCGEDYQITGDMCGEEPSEGEKSNNIDGPGRCAQNSNQQPVGLD
jgi:hypothetical protein